VYALTRSAAKACVRGKYCSGIKNAPETLLTGSIPLGFHRLGATRSLGWEKIAADVRQGTRRDAVLFSVGANGLHGHRRTNEDKKRAVKTLLDDDEWKKMSDREIARLCGVTHPFVSSLRSVSGNGFQISEPRTVTRGDSTYTMNVGNIGGGTIVRGDPHASWVWTPHDIPGTQTSLTEP
jgi:hypothetical protein